MTTTTALRFLRAVQVELKAQGHNHKLDQHEYEIVLGAMNVHGTAHAAASDIIDDRKGV